MHSLSQSHNAINADGAGFLRRVLSIALILLDRKKKMQRIVIALCS